MKKVILIIPVIFLAFIMLLNCSKSGNKTPVAVKGVLDLRNWDFENDGNIKLNGEWEFYWKKFLNPVLLTKTTEPPETFINVPRPWNHIKINDESISYSGYATYHLKVLLKKQRRLSLQLPPIDTAYDLYVNEKLVDSVGKTGKSVTESKPLHRFNVIDIDPDIPQLDIVFHISNYHLSIGGLSCSLKLGESEAIQASSNCSKAFNVFMFSMIFVMGTYHLSLFLLRRSDRSLLYFSIFAFLYAVYTFMLDNSFFNFLIGEMDWEVGSIIIFGSLYLSLPVFILFTAKLFPDEVAPWFVKASLMCSLGTIILLVFFPPHIHVYTLNIFIGLQLLTTVYLMYVYIVAKFRKREGARILFIGYLLHLAFLIHDAFHFYGFLDTMFLAPLGAYALIMSHAYLLKVKYIKSFETIEKLSHELELKNEKLLELDNLKDEFLANTSHELRTPLHAISGLTESLIDGSGGDLPENAYHTLSLIELSSRRLTNLVNDILDFSKLKYKNIHLNIVAVNLHALTHIVFDYFKPLIGSKKIQLVNNVDKTIPLVAVDECRLQQVCFNILGNAVKFTREGEISISACLQENQNGPNFVEVTMADTGLGIEQSKLKQIFKPFEQADEKIAQKFGGTGIGLSIVKKIIELHNGTINIFSEKEKGTKVIFTLPEADESIINKTQDNKSECSFNFCNMHNKVSRHFSNQTDTNITKKQMHKRPVENDTQKSRILVVDDEQVNLEVIYQYFYGQNYEIDTAMNGHEALQLVNQNSYDLVLLDIMMPEMSGYEVCQHIRKKYSNYELPVIMLTAKDAIDNIINGFDVGTNDYISKPVNKDELLIRVKNLVALRKAVKKHNEVEYKLLQERMNPHFLFNALNTIHALLYTNSETADKALMKLAEIYRYVTDSSNHVSIAFTEEWNFLINYLEMEQLQYGDSLEVAVSLDGDFAGLYIPPLTLQPILENIFKHALNSIDDMGRIEITGKNENGKVTIQFCDNGPGLGGAVDYSGSLGNIVKRLQFYYTGVSIKLEENDERGVTATLSFQEAIESKEYLVQ